MSTIDWTVYKLKFSNIKRENVVELLEPKF